MRILYNSKDIRFKQPFGTLTEGQSCRISIHIPKSCQTRAVKLVLLQENKVEYSSFELYLDEKTEDYEIYSCGFSIDRADLYFYYFRITTANEEFSLFRFGYDDTNMEEGELWQLSCVPSDFRVPEEYAGSIMYQIFPDRFYAVGQCEASHKLCPFWIHENKNDLPSYLPNEQGEVENCDFFGGNLKGISAKLDYLKELNVSVIYLNPIFKAWSNHRYDTADYMKIDELLGTEEDFRELCEMAHERGIKIILDGVFSHTGSNSRYFDKLGIFGGGAYHCPDSPYRSWYTFEKYPDVYISWWGIKTLPCTNENDESFKEFIINGNDSVLAHWINAGADGFRLDVADELPDEFIADFRARLKGLNPDSLLIGEVWEDASNKISYGVRRRYFTGAELDSVMNYPIKNAIVDFVCGNDDGTCFEETVMTISENYPADVVRTLMNSLSTHDTSRILSLLATEQPPYEKNECAGYMIPEHARGEAIERLFVAVFLQFVLPGMPCIYYGDEIGMEGLGDPFCRGYFKWDLVENNTIREFFVSVTKMRSESEVLKLGDVTVKSYGGGHIEIKRVYKGSVYLAHVNVGDTIRIALRGESLLDRKTHICDKDATIERYGFILERFFEEM